jgi:hypothetical protein
MRLVVFDRKPLLVSILNLNPENNQCDSSANVDRIEGNASVLIG